MYPLSLPYHCRRLLQWQRCPPPGRGRRSKPPANATRHPTIRTAPPDDEGGPPMEPDADAAAPDAAVRRHRARPLVFKGRHVFLVEAKLLPEGAAGLPSSHAFTLILDGDAGRALLGSSDGVWIGPVHDGRR